MVRAQLQRLFRVCAFGLGCLSAFPLGAEDSATAAPRPVDFERRGDTFRLTIAGEWLGDYRLSGSSKPFLAPLLGPGGVPLTRDWPLAAGSSDHPHHESLWYGHGAVNGEDFWRGGPNRGRAELAEVLEARVEPDAVVIRTRHRLLGTDRREIATDERLLRVHARRDCRVLDYEVTWCATSGPLTLGATKESALGIRVAESMRADRPPASASPLPGGEFVNSAGLRNELVRSSRATWVDYHGPVGGQTMGIALLDHPTNPLHPPWWLCREYGLLAATPFGGHELGNQPVADSELRLEAGARVTFRYRIVLHAGDEKAADIAGMFEAYAREGPTAAPGQR